MAARRTVSVTADEIAAVWAMADEASRALHLLVPDSDEDAAAASVCSWLELIYGSVARAAEAKISPGQMRFPL